MDLNSENTGLLHRAQTILADVTPAFNTWVKRSGFKRAVVLSPVNTSQGIYYCVTDSFGLEAEEIARIKGSDEYWKETLSKAFEWQCFSFDFNELDKFIDFFDDYTFEKISKIFFLPFGDKEQPYIFMTVEYSDDDDIFLDEASEVAVRLKNIKEFQNQEEKLKAKFEKNIDEGLQISDSSLFILSLKLWIEDSIKNIEFDNDEEKNAVVETIAKQALIFMEPLIRSPNCVHIGKNGELKIVLFAKEDPDEQLLAHHISRTLLDLFGRSRSENAKAQFLSAGKCSNKAGSLAFLFQD